MEIRDLLTFYQYDGDNSPLIKGSALADLKGEPKWVETVMQLMNAVDTSTAEPVRDNEKPFLMPIEDVFTITGPCTVARGLSAPGVDNTGDHVEIIGMGAD